jgi:hypothetical protein
VVWEQVKSHEVNLAVEEEDLAEAGRMAPGRG